MENSNYVWELRANNVSLGTLTPYGWYDFPWIGCKFEPTHEFENYRHLFDDSLHFLEIGDVEELELLNEQINEQIELFPINDSTQLVSEYSLYIDGNNTRLRAIFVDSPKE